MFVLKLELDLIREILLAIESASDSNKNFDVEFLYDNYPNLKDWSYLTVKYHIRQLADGGYIFVTDTKKPYNIGLIIDLSWKGHDFLADIRPQTTWERLKGVLSVSASASLEAIKTVSCALAEEALKTLLHP